MSNLISQPISPNLRVAISGNGAVELAQVLNLALTPLAEADAVIFVVSAVSGFSSDLPAAWEEARSRYIPSLVAIGELENSDIDFEDMSAIVGKTLDPIVTPYLVLHSDEGFPTALINLSNLMITDYSMGLKRTIDSDPEHKELVAEFREEYLAEIEVTGEDGFEQGLLFPAIPISLHIKLGIAEINEYLHRIPSSS
ncbi:MAG: hypothetical protein WCO85_02315 [Actinomycetes bacterium]